MPNTNVSTVTTIEVNENEVIEASLTVEEREEPFIFATIERLELETDEVFETMSIADAEVLHKALGEAIEAAKSAVTAEIVAWKGEGQ